MMNTVNSMLALSLGAYQHADSLAETLVYMVCLLSYILFLLKFGQWLFNVSLFLSIIHSALDEMLNWFKLVDNWTFKKLTL